MKDVSMKFLICYIIISFFAYSYCCDVNVNYTWVEKHLAGGDDGGFPVDNSNLVICYNGFVTIM